MPTFALVHGAGSGAWCWQKLSLELESLGHRVITMDLPCDVASATFDDYADVVCAAVSDVAGDDLTLVGHALAGQTIPLVAARRPVQRLVYLCAVPAIPGQSLAQLMVGEEILNPGYPRALSEMDSGGRRLWLDRELANYYMYSDCDETTARDAFARLRPQSMRHFTLPCSLPALPTVESTYVVCTEDRLLNPAWARRIALDWLDADLIEIPGSHSPFLSRPAELAELLHRLD
ncbi:alpha/beta fold hydrolase [Mycobacterium colombiense]|uniref:alpha/beta fold hydrolase n=1 Tax=Mycobacterium colombiense TaxID=339268 RepID=UPI00200A3E4F|nr:alpha/beta fold hydrolase [Mycobacterium colombiense]MCK8647140.1 alpha/beta fold hydrolase [Mycobacterium colombiense]